MSWLKCCICKTKHRETVTVLDFSRCALVDVPPEVFNHERTLEVLYIDGNKIVDLPRTLFQCEELRYLYASDNEILTIPALISKLVNLQHLNLSRNFIKHDDIHHHISRCQNLNVLDLSSNNLDKVPECIATLLNLEQLYLNDTYIEFLPANFGRLCHLRILELRDNTLSTLPKSLRRLTCLTRLDISNNDFIALPEVIAYLRNLTELWVNGNCLKYVPNFIGNLGLLTHFDASKNDIEYIPSDIKKCINLTMLVLSNNQLRSVPDDIGYLTRLEVLKLDFNNLESLPRTIAHFKNLEDLDVQNNQLTVLPNTIGFLRKLGCFIASQNFIGVVPPEIGSCSSLTVLTLHNNCITKIPEEIGHLQNLVSLGLIGNKLDYLPITISHMTKLKALWLSQNQSHPLIPLSCEKHHNGQRILTCFLLPQVNRSVDHTPTTSASTSGTRRHICFVEPGVRQEMAPQLTRAPTPYPKDLQKYKHLLLKAMRRRKEPDTDSLSYDADPETPQIKEAKVTAMKSNIPALPAMHNSDNSSAGSASPKMHDVTTKTQMEITQNHGDGDSGIIEVVQEHNYPRVEHFNEFPVQSNFTDVTSPMQDCGNGNLTPALEEIGTTKRQPPPYHIAATYSKNAHFFKNINLKNPHLDTISGYVDGISVDEPRNFIQDQPANIPQPQAQHPYEKYSPLTAMTKEELQKYKYQMKNQIKNSDGYPFADDPQSHEYQQVYDHFEIQKNIRENLYEKNQYNLPLKHNNRVTEQNINKGSGYSVTSRMQQNLHNQREVDNNVNPLLIETLTKKAYRKNNQNMQLNIQQQLENNSGITIQTDDVKGATPKSPLKWIFGAHHNPKLIEIQITPCCYVLGFSVYYNENGVFVDAVDEAGNANGKLQSGDKIVMIDEVDITKMEPDQAAKLVMVRGPETESFLISRV